jgi:hypothetical protein
MVTFAGAVYSRSDRQSCRSILATRPFAQGVVSIFRIACNTRRHIRGRQLGRLFPHRIAPGMLGWLCVQAANGAKTWYAPFCDSNKIQTLGRATKSAMQGEFTFDPSATLEQREYIEH